MSEGSNNESLIWEDNEEWFSIDDQVGNGWNLTDDKLLDSDSSDASQPPIAVKEAVEATSVDGKRSPTNQKDEAESYAGASGEKGDQPDHAIHILTERERRKQMRNLFENLRALLPQLPHKADDSTIVDEAVNYIKTLHNTFNKLQEQKLERLQQGIGLSTTWEHVLSDHGSASNSAAITPTNHTTTTNNNVIRIGFQTWYSPNVILSVCGEEAHISVCCPKKAGLFSFICHVMEKLKIDIVSAQVSSDHFRSMILIQAHARGESGLDQFSKAFSVEEIYKKAAAEIMSWATPQ
ncbi:unnamed protein product [Withania somnifera]